MSLRQSGAVHRGAVGQPSSSYRAPAIMSLRPTNLIISLHLKRVQFKILLWKAAAQLGPLDVSISLRIWLGDQRWNCVVVSIKPTVAIIVSNSGTPSTDYAKPAMCAETHSSRKTARLGMKNSTIITSMDMAMIMVNRTSKKMTRWVIDI